MEPITFDKSRVVSFSDAVFSIAMTLLVLEVAIPDAKEVTTNSLGSILGNRIPSFIGLIVSFLVTALYWIAHMRIMRYVKEVSYKLLWLNILLLLFIVLLPFSTGLYVKGFNAVSPFAFYCFNLSAIGFFNYLMIRYISKHEEEVTPIVGQSEKARALMSMFVWIFSGILAFILPLTSRFVFVLIFVFQPFINRYFKKKKAALTLSSAQTTESVETTEDDEQE
ncbi:TMEM175 family protein [uncultured Kordia sp.]|uniref:TMEM175 family protein n=1 Tax=uncultured Kordia sp. TaxID=507699 RepID=UPI0026315428|nr:TMEM175 family protein [uncultured Kordia sp.]